MDLLIGTIQKGYVLDVPIPILIIEELLRTNDRLSIENRGLVRGVLRKQAQGPREDETKG